MRCMKPNMRWLDKVKSMLQPDEPKILMNAPRNLIGDVDAVFHETGPEGRKKITSG